jgi:hypothetical protein
MEGNTDYKDSRKIEIMGELRVKNDGGAQLVVCHLEDDDEDYVAKIHDPLYYGFSDTMWPDLSRDVTFESNMDYCREVAAYEEMDRWVGGTDVPKFHGPWTFQLPLNLPAGQKLMRYVRMNLIKKMPDKPMLEYNKHTLPEIERLETLAHMAELISRIAFIGVYHHDISQRNIMVCDGENAGTVGRITLIDFNMSTVERLDSIEEQYGPESLGLLATSRPIRSTCGGEEAGTQALLSGCLRYGRRDYGPCRNGCMKDEANTKTLLPQLGNSCGTGRISREIGLLGE